MCLICSVWKDGRDGNEAIKIVCVWVLAFLDSDDCLTENSVEVRLAAMRENRCGFV